MIGGAAAASTALAAPAVAQAKKDLVIVSTWPRDFPGLGTSAQRLAKNITDMSDGAFNVEYRHTVFNGMLCSGTLNGVQNDLFSLLSCSQFGLVEDIFDL